ncbi:uracil DNA glycosylase [Mycoemilia scoparia]|uniref:Uracil-DNA glycosylase n=1 Tax=Mycoemilia scoparia TaxID=417184 RepID=A0A9W7ZQC1_9FUNG|nr:uracil DNA glycosylase [Mycoemilia scoparia]
MDNISTTTTPSKKRKPVTLTDFFSSKTPQKALQKPTSGNKRMKTTNNNDGSNSSSIGQNRNPSSPTIKTTKDDNAGIDLLDGGRGDGDDDELEKLATETEKQATKPQSSENPKASSTSATTTTTTSNIGNFFGGHPSSTSTDGNANSGLMTTQELQSLPPTVYEANKLEYSTMDKTWLKVLSPEFNKPYFRKLKQFLASQAAVQIFPPPSQIYSWSRYSPFNKVKVVILGQDPYHNFNQAHGLSFSVKPGVRIPPSLLNIYKELELEYPDGKFQKPKHGFLKGWAEQGVLMLNACLTVQAHKPNSHANQGWEEFTDAVIREISERKTGVVFILWGSYAQKKGKGINKKKHLVLTSVHPSPLSASRGFFNCGHFKKANEYLKSINKNIIHWNRLPIDDDDDVNDVQDLVGKK